MAASASWSKEYVASCDPDLIIGWSSSFSDSSTIGSLSYWNSMGVNCFRTNIYGNANGTSVDTYYDLMETMGLMFNEKEKADAAIAKWKGYSDDIAERTAGITDRPDVLIVDYSPSQSGTICVYGTSMLTGNLVKMAGGNVLSDGRMDRWSLETIANTHPDIVLVVGLGYYTTISESESQTIVDWWNSIDAFKGVCDNIVPVPFYSVYMSGILDDDCLNMLYDIMYG